MEIHTYQLDDFYKIMRGSEAFALPDSYYALLKSVDEQIVPIVIEKTADKPSYRSKQTNHHYKEEYKSTRSRGGGGRDHRDRDRDRDRDRETKDKDDLTWQSIRNFKPTNLDKKQGKERIFNDIRICLNKLSTKNYDTQKTQVFQLLDELKQECETNPESAPTITLHKIAEAIFEIASTNMFYAEIYAKLYKELIVYDSVYQEVMNSFLANYSNGIKEMNYIDPDVNYEGFCDYNKKNDMRKATAVFVICLMKEEVIPTLKVLNLMQSFIEMGVQYVEEENRNNEVEEIAEVLYLFLQRGMSYFVNCKAEWIWKFMITKHIQTFSQYKKVDKKSLSSRAIFKYMDMMQLIEKQS